MTALSHPQPSRSHHHARPVHLPRALQAPPHLNVIAPAIAGHTHVVTTSYVSAAMRTLDKQMVAGVVLNEAGQIQMTSQCALRVSVQACKWIYYARIVDDITSR